MEQNNPKFRLKLNLFDGIVLLLALAVGAVLLWTALKPATTLSTADAPTASTVQYTVRFQKWMEGTGALIEPGDKLVDNIKNFEMGEVISTEVVPAYSQQLDHNTRQYVQALVPGYEDVFVTVKSTCTISDEAISVGGGYAVQVGDMAYIRGEGYLASGPIVAIDREGLK